MKFTAEFKARIVAEVLHGERTAAQIGAEHGIDALLVDRWKDSAERAGRRRVPEPKTSDAPESIGMRIRQLRNQCGMSRETLAAAVGVSLTHVGRWENNKGDGIPHLPRIADILGVPPEFFLNGMRSRASTETLTIDEAEMLRRYRACGLTGRVLMIRYLEALAYGRKPRPPLAPAVRQAPREVVRLRVENRQNKTADS